MDESLQLLLTLLIFNTWCIGTPSECTSHLRKYTSLEQFIVSLNSDKIASQNRVLSARKALEYFNPLKQIQMQINENKKYVILRKDDTDTIYDHLLRPHPLNRRDFVESVHGAWDETVAYNKQLNAEKKQKEKLYKISQPIKTSFFDVETSNTLRKNFAKLGYRLEILSQQQSPSRQELPERYTENQIPPDHGGSKPLQNDNAEESILREQYKRDVSKLSPSDTSLKPNNTRKEDPDSSPEGLRMALLRASRQGVATAGVEVAVKTLEGPLWATARGERGRCVALVRDGAAPESDSALVAAMARTGAAAVVVTVALKEARGDKSTEIEEASYAQLLRAPVDAPCRAVILRVRTPRKVLRAFGDAVRRGQQRAQRRFLLLPTSLDTRNATAVESVLDMREMEFMPDLVEVVPSPAAASSESPTFEAATHAFVGAGDTWRRRLVLDEWRDGKWAHGGAGLYPDKVRDLRGRHFAFASFNYAPYVILPPDGAPDGVELRISKEFAERHNMTWTVSVDADNEWGEIFDNFSGNGILGSVSSERAALGFGALYLWHHEYQFVDFSAPYIRTGITCLAPRPRPLPGVLTPVLPFGGRLWLALAVALVGSAGALRAVAWASRAIAGEEEAGARWASLGECAFRTLGLLALQTPAAERREDGREKGALRHLLNWLTITFLLITTSYASGLASVLAVPRSEPPIDSAWQLARSPVRWAATHEAWVFSLRDATDSLGRTLLKRFQVLDANELKHRAAQGDLAFAVERLPAGHFAVGPYVDQSSVSGLRLMSGDLYWERSTTVAPKGSALLAPLSALVHRLLDAGLMAQWEAQVARAFLSQRMQDSVRRSGAPAVAPEEPQQLRLAHVEGGFCLLALGLAAAAVACVAEVLVARGTNKRADTTQTKNLGERPQGDYEVISRGTRRRVLIVDY